MIPPPPRACDTHAHIFGPVSRYPLAKDRDWTPPDRPVEAYASMLDALGIERGVIVHASSHGTDNRVTLDAIARMGNRCRGIAIVAPEVTDRELEALARGGMRGIRISTMLKGAMGVRHIDEMAARLEGLGWNIEIHFDSPDEIIELVPTLRGLSVDYVIDHLGRNRGGRGVRTPAFQALLRLLKESERCWVKICSWYRLSDRGPPYDDMRPFVEALMAARVDRLLWGSNWPHPMFKDPIPDDGELLDQIQLWAGPARQAILVDNPARLYGFG